MKKYNAFNSRNYNQNPKYHSALNIIESIEYIETNKNFVVSHFGRVDYVRIPTSGLMININQYYTPQNLNKYLTIFIEEVKTCFYNIITLDKLYKTSNFFNAFLSFIQDSDYLEQGLKDALHFAKIILTNMDHAGIITDVKPMISLLQSLSNDTHPEKNSENYQLTFISSVEACAYLNILENTVSSPIYLADNRLILNSSIFEELRQVIRQNVSAEAPKQNRVFSKCLRSDEMNYFHSFMDELINGAKFPKRLGCKRTYTVTALGLFSRELPSQLPVKKPQYTLNQKRGFTNFQSASLVLPGRLEPTPFGFDRNDLLINFQFAEKDGLLSNRNYVYDGGTITRPYDFYSIKDATNYQKSKDETMFSAEALGDLEKTLLEKKYLGCYSELLVRLRWNPDNSSRITISTDNLETRLLAKTYANTLVENLKKNQQCPLDYQLPLFFYTPHDLNVHNKPYTEEQYLLDCLEAHTILNSSKLKTEKYQQHRWEFLLGLPSTLVKKELLAQARAMLSTGYIHMFRFLQEKTKLNFDTICMPIFTLLKPTEQMHQDYDLKMRNFIQEVLIYFHHALRARHFVLAEYFYQQLLLLPRNESLKQANKVLTLAIDHQLNDWAKKIIKLPFIGNTQIKKALFNAAITGNVALVTFLVNEHISIHAIDKNGCTALISACQYGHIGVVQFLVTHGADINAQNKDGMTGLMSASTEGHAHIVSYLLNCKADFKILNHKNESLLYISALYAQVEIVTLLLQENAQINFNFDDNLGIEPKVKELLSNKLRADEIIKQAGEIPSGPIALQIAHLFDTYAHSPLLCWRHHSFEASVISSLLIHETTWNLEQCLIFIESVLPANSYNKTGTFAGLMWAIKNKQNITPEESINSFSV